eukprot:1601067-Pleurochrysis_carterae.AAC.2
MPAQRPGHACATAYACVRARTPRARLRTRALAVCEPPAGGARQGDRAALRGRGDHLLRTRAARARRRRGGGALHW